MYITDVNTYAKTIQISRDTNIDVTSGFVNPFTNVSTVVLDADNDPAQGATISVVEDQFKYDTAQADGKVYLEDVDRNHSVQINYAGAEPLIFKASELPAQVVFTDAMLTHQLDEVILTIPKPKSKSNWIPNLVIGACFTGIIYTVVKAINEEKAQPIHL